MRESSMRNLCAMRIRRDEGGNGAFRGDRTEGARGRPVHRKHLGAAQKMPLISCERDQHSSAIPRRCSSQVRTRGHTSHTTAEPEFFSCA